MQCNLARRLIRSRAQRGFWNMRARSMHCAPRRAQGPTQTTNQGRGFESCWARQKAKSPSGLHLPLEGIQGRVRFCYHLQPKHARPSSRWGVAASIELVRKGYGSSHGEGLVGLARTKARCGLNMRRTSGGQGGLSRAAACARSPASSQAGDAAKPVQPGLLCTFDASGERQLKSSPPNIGVIDQSGK